jgi:hypothetical protein
MRTARCATLALLIAGCTQSAVTCPTGTFPCGNGCISGNDVVCCDPGNASTSSYCSGSIGGGCYDNDRGCPLAGSTSAKAAFCCGVLGATGSNDCPAGQHHCGTTCFPLDHDCCPNGSCPEAAWDPTECTSTTATDVGCAVCMSSGQQAMCVSCPAGSCCHGDPCAGGDCVIGGACTGAPAMSSSDCTGGATGSLRLCIQNGTSGPCACNTATTSTCITPQVWAASGSGAFPSACAPLGASCVGSDGRTLTAYCCPGLSCFGVGGPACGNGQGTCQQHP